MIQTKEEEKRDAHLKFFSMMSCYGCCDVPVTLNETTQSHNEVNLCSSDWLMGSELGYLACSLISGSNDGAPTLI